MVCSGYCTVGKMEDCSSECLGLEPVLGKFSFATMKISNLHYDACRSGAFLATVGSSGSCVCVCGIKNGTFILVSWSLWFFLISIFCTVVFPKKKTDGFSSEASFLAIFFHKMFLFSFCSLPLTLSFPSLSISLSLSLSLSLLLSFLSVSLSIYLIYSFFLSLAFLSSRFCVLFFFVSLSISLFLSLSLFYSLCVCVFASLYLFSLLLSVSLPPLSLRPCIFLYVFPYLSRSLSCFFFLLSLTTL